MRLTESIIMNLKDSYKYGTMTLEQFDDITSRLGISKSDISGGIIRFSKVDINLIKEFVTEGLMSAYEKHNDSPTVGEMIELSEKSDIYNVTVDGYVVVPTRSDSRISLDGINFNFVITTRLSDAERFIKSASEKEIKTYDEEGYGFATAWWD